MKIALAVGGAIAIAAILVYASSGGTDDRIRVAFLPSVSHAIPIIGTENGTFEDALGGSAYIESRILDSGTQAAHSLVSGNLDIAYVGPGPALSAFVQSGNQKITILAGAASGGVSLVAHRDSQISQATDLDGKRVAVPQIANTQDVSLRYYLLENGLEAADRGGSVHVIAAAGPEIYTLFARDSVDAAWVPEPWATLLVESLGAERILYEESLWPDSRFSTVVLAARSAYVDEHPEIISAWLDAHNQTADWIRSNPQLALGAYASFAQHEAIVNLPHDVIAESFTNVEITVDPLKESIDTFAQRAASLGYLGRGAPTISGIFYGEEPAGV